MATFGRSTTPSDALAASGADAVMIGRAAQGRPWFPGQVARYLATGTRESDAAARRAIRLIDTLYDEMLGAPRPSDRPPARPQASRPGRSMPRRRRAGVSARHAQEPSRPRAHRRRTGAGAPSTGRRLRRLRLEGRRMSRAHAISTTVNSPADAVLQRAAASGDHGLARRPDRRRQCRRRAILRGLDPAAAPAHAARPGAVRLAAARADRAGAPARRGGQRIQGRSRHPAQSGRAARRSAMSRRCRNIPTTSSSCCRSAPSPTRWTASSPIAAPRAR